MELSCLGTTCTHWVLRPRRSVPLPVFESLNVSSGRTTPTLVGVGSRSQILGRHHRLRGQTLDRNLVVSQKTTSVLASSLKTAVIAPLRQQRPAPLKRTRSTPGTTYTQRRASRLETWPGVLPCALTTASASFGLTTRESRSAG